MLIIDRIVELVKSHGNMNTSEVVSLFGLHRGTAEKYLRIALERGGFIRHGRCGIFRDQRAVIDYDLKRYSSSQVSKERRSRPVRRSLITSENGMITC